MESSEPLRVYRMTVVDKEKEEFLCKDELYISKLIMEDFKIAWAVDHAELLKKYKQENIYFHIAQLHID